MHIPFNEIVQRTSEIPPIYTVTAYNTNNTNAFSMHAGTYTVCGLVLPYVHNGEHITHFIFGAKHIGLFHVLFDTDFQSIC